MPSTEAYSLIWNAFGGTAIGNIPAFIPWILVGLSCIIISRNPRKISILLFPVSIGWSTVFPNIGWLWMMVTGILFIGSAVGIEGTYNIISTAAKVTQTGVRTAIRARAGIPIGTQMAEGLMKRAGIAKKERTELKEISAGERLNAKDQFALEKILNKTARQKEPWQKVPNLNIAGSKILQNITQTTRGRMTRQRTKPSILSNEYWKERQEGTPHDEAFDKVKKKFGI